MNETIEIEGLKTLYGFVSNPNTKDMKIKSYESLIYATLLQKETTTISTEDIIKYGKENGLTNISSLILQKVINQLSEEKTIEKSSDGEITFLSKEKLERFKKQNEENKRKTIEFYNFMISKVQNYFKDIFTPTDILNLKHFIGGIITEIMEHYSDSVIDLYMGSFQLTDRENLDMIIKKRIEDLNINDNFSKEEIRSIVMKVFTKQFQNPNKIFSNALRLFAIRKIMSKVIIKNPSMRGVQKEFFKDSKLFIDTNILIFLLCKSSRLYEVTNDLLIETKKLGGEVLISDITIQEFIHSMENAKFIYKKIKQGKIKPHETDSDIITTFCDMSSQKKDWYDFIRELNDNLGNFLTSELLIQVDIEEPNFNEFKKLENILSKEYKKLNIEKQRALISHDAIMILNIQNSRTIDELTIGTYWFLTADEKLRRIEKKNLTKMGFKSESLISCDVWFEMLLPFINLEYDEENISKSFSKLLGVNLIPYTTDLIDSYIRNLSIQLELEEKDYKLLKKRIENVHVRNSIENALINEDYQGANIILKEILIDSKEKEELEKTIRSLSAQVRAMGAPGHSTFIDIKKVGKLIEKVETASTNNEKGKTLEDLAEYLFSNINGLNLIDRDSRLESEEIDLIYSNSAFITWKDPILIECKNWSKPISKTAVVDFLDKIITSDASTGIFITIHGVTGDDYKDVMSKIKRALQDKIHILVVKLEEIKEIEDPDKFIDILTKKYYLPTKF